MKIGRQTALILVAAFSLFSAIVVRAQEMPKAQIALVNSEEVVNGGFRMRAYEIEVVNRAEFANELFTSSPDLPPCGKNPNSSRTWINIYNEKGDRLYGHCGIRSNEELSSIKLRVSTNIKLPKKIYLEFIDRRQNKKLRSNEIRVQVDN